jgi:hypothetical protein
MITPFLAEISKKTFNTSLKLGYNFSKNMSYQSRKNRIAICQITCNDNKNENFEICKKLITGAKNQDAKVNFVPMITVFKYFCY